MKTSFLMKVAGALLLAAAATTSSAAADKRPVKVRMSVDEQPIVPALAASLGYFAREGLEIVPVRIEDFSPNDYELQSPLIRGDIDVAYHWFNHAVFGARHGLPVTAVMVINDAPGMTVMVSNRARDRIRSAADFRGVNVAEGAGYATKSLLTHYLTTRAGLPDRSYNSVITEVAGRQENVIKGLAAGTVDVVTAQEPMTSALRDAGLVTTLYDLNDAEATTRVLGAAWPAQSLLVSPDLIKRRPDVVQRVVNAFVRTMRFVNSHSAEEIASALPRTYFQGKDRAKEIETIRAALPTFAKGSYAVKPASVRLVVDSIEAFPFDQSPTGKWRSADRVDRLNLKGLYDNRFVTKAMRAIR